MSQKIVTPEFRGSFVSLVEPSIPPGASEDAARYQITIVLPSDHPFIEKITEACEAVAYEKFGKNIKFGTGRGKVRLPFKDGDETGYAEHEGAVTFQAATRRKPEVVDSDLQPIMDADEIYSGAWYRASIVPFAWDHPTGGKGVSLSLSNVMKVKDDDAFDGRTSAASDFAAFGEDADKSELLD